jgi:hypothetical protein
MTAVEDKLPPSDTGSLGDEAPTVTQQEPTLTQPESEEEIVFDPPEAEEDYNSYSSNPRQPTAVMLTVEIDGVTCEKLESKMSFSKTSEADLFKKEEHPNLSIDEQTVLFKSAVAKTHKLYNLMPLFFDDKDKLDDTYNLSKSWLGRPNAHIFYTIYIISFLSSFLTMTKLSRKSRTSIPTIPTSPLSKSPD